MTNTHQHRMPTLACSSTVAAIRTGSHLSVLGIKCGLLCSLLAVFCIYANAQQTVSLSGIGLRQEGDTLKAVRVNVPSMGLQSGDMFEYLSVQPANLYGVKGIAGGFRKETGPLVFTEADIPAQYPGGESAWLQWIASQKFPMDLSDEGGVLVTFVIDAEGNMGEVAILNTVSTAAARQAQRILALSGKWQPAVHQKTNVSFRVYKLIAW